MNNQSLNPASQEGLRLFGLNGYKMVIPCAFPRRLKQVYA